MPLSSEVVTNKPLSGKELARIVLKDLEEVLEKDGMFGEHIAYGKVSYVVEVRMELDNFTYPRHQARTHARKTEIIEGPPPLATASDEKIELDLERSREIDSPNSARAEAGLPITVQVHEGGKLVQKEVLYDKSEAPPAGSVKDLDKSPRRPKV